MLSAKRFREHAGLFAALLGVVALVSGLSVGVVGFLAQSADVGVRSGLETRAGADRALRASLALDADAQKQDSEVRAAIARSFPHIGMDVDRTIGARIEISTLDADGVRHPLQRAQLLSIPDLPERATLVAGTWPTGPDETSLQADGAERLEVTPGDRIQIGDTTITVTGTWRVNDPLDPRWMGDTLITDGLDVDAGPIVIDESLWSQLDTDPRVRWTLVPDVTHITAPQLASIVTEWNSLGTQWRGQVSSQLITLEKTGRFKRSALELGTRVDGLQAIQPVVLLLLAAIMLVTLAELGRLLTTTRDSEIALLWSRGASALDVARATAAEVAAAAAVGAALGAGVALAALAVFESPEALTAVGATAWVFPLAVTLSAILVVAGSALRSARRQTVRDPSDAAGRARRLAGPGVVVLAVAAAGLSVWQLQIYGSPLTPTAEGGTDVDPIGVVAPALTLVAVVLLALILFPRVAALAELATRRAGLLRILAARTVARRLQLVAAPIVVVAVASATLVVASGYSATWSDSFDRTSALRAGAPLHISTGFRSLDLETVEAIGATPGVDGVAPIDFEVLQIGGDTGSIVAVAPAAIANVASAASGSFDRAKAARAATIDLPGPDLPAGTSTITLTTAQNGFAVTPSVSLQVLDGYGVLREVVLGAPEDLGEDSVLSTEQFVFHDVRYTATVPRELAAAPAPWHVMTVDTDLAREAVTGDGVAQFVMSELSADGTALELDKFWIPDSPLVYYDPLLSSNHNGLGFTVGPDALAVRLTPSFNDDISDRFSPPVVISQQLADLYNVGVGDPLSFALEDASERTDATIAMITPAIPGADLETAVMLDLGYVIHQRLRLTNDPAAAREFWVDTSDPDGVAAALRTQLPANTRMQSAEDPVGRTVLGSAALALWLGAIGCLVLTLITVIAVVRAQVRSRRLDVVVLRAIGLGARDQAGIRRRELGLVLGFGALTGLAAGAAVALLTVPQLARAAVVQPYTTVPTPLGFDLVALGAGLAALVVALVIIVSAYTSLVARQARTAIGAEEVG